MAVSYEDLKEDLRRIIISGRLDIEGTEKIAPKFTELTATAKRYVVVDFTEVTFLASIGIRALISNAKALHKLGGKMAVVVGQNSTVLKTLDAVGISALLQMFTATNDAETSLRN